MRAMSVVFLAGFALNAAIAQSTQVDRITDAYTTLRGQSEQYLKVTGTVTTPKATTTYEVDAYYSQTPSTTAGADPTAEKLDIALYVDGSATPSRRIVGDGSLLWSYDYSRQTYWVASYQKWASATSTYVHNHAAFMKLMSQASISETASIGRLLREVYSADSPAYTSWLPGATVADGSTNALDVVLAVGAPVRRQVTFGLTQETDTDPIKLATITYYDLTTVSSLSRETHWTLQVLDVANMPSQLDAIPLTAAQLAGWKQVVHPVAAIQ